MDLERNLQVIFACTLMIMSLFVCTVMSWSTYVCTGKCRVKIVRDGLHNYLIESYNNTSDVGVKYFAILALAFLCMSGMKTYSIG